MKLRLLACSLLALLTAGSARAEGYSHKEPFTKTHAFSSSGELELHNVNGSVTVRTWDRNEILIEGEKSAKTEEELRQIDLTMEISESRAFLKVRLPKREGGWFGSGNIRASVRFTITLPATASLDGVETVNSSVTIEGVRGAVRSRTVNGGIRATNLGGSAELDTVNGSIKAEFAGLASGQQLSFETVNGQVVVRLPKDAGAELRASVVNGNIDCDFPLQLTKSSRRSLHGTIGGGGSTVEAKTVNGSISIEQR